MNKLADKINSRLMRLMDKMCEPGVLKDAMCYSLLGGGKRLRPTLCLMSADIYGGAGKALDFACAIEMIHTYSLIHDDLPAMDNDVLRRGKPTCHVVFGEGNAILAGDGLLNCAFETMLGAALREKEYANYVKATRIIAKAAGARGMIAGQAADISFEGKGLDLKALEFIHIRKTAALISASVTAGAALLNAPEDEIAALGAYGGCVGLAFQIVDDILDIKGDGAILGKSTGKDELSGKLTFVRAMGTDASRVIAREKTKEAKEALACFGGRAKALADMADMLLNRDR